MKPRHAAAALALVGWYLMLPPLIGPPHEKDIDSKAPVSQWEINKSFDSAEECEDFRTGMEQLNQREVPKNPAKTATERIALRYLYSACVASDDPRLAK